MVELQPSKLTTWVRFPSPALLKKSYEIILIALFCVRPEWVQVYASSRSTIRWPPRSTTKKRNWTDKQRNDILNGKTTQYNREPMEGHHKYNAIHYLQIADDPTNIYPATDDEHFKRWHGGNYQNDIYGVPNN